MLCPHPSPCSLFQDEVTSTPAQDAESFYSDAMLVRWAPASAPRTRLPVSEALPQHGWMPAPRPAPPPLQIPTSVIDTLNDAVRSLGRQRVEALKDTMEFRRTFQHMQWEARVLATREKDAREYYKDLQLMRAMGDVRQFIEGERGN